MPPVGCLEVSGSVNRATSTFGWINFNNASFVQRKRSFSKTLSQMDRFECAVFHIVCEKTETLKNNDVFSVMWPSQLEPNMTVDDGALWLLCLLSSLIAPLKINVTLYNQQTGRLTETTHGETSYVFVWVVFNVCAVYGMQALSMGTSDFWKTSEKRQCRRRVFFKMKIQFSDPSGSMWR